MEMEGDGKQVQRGVWENTNRMLGEGWSGIKTGITPNAGPCLAASCFKAIGGREYEYLIILLSSENMEARWSEVRRLMAWVEESLQGR
jgi:serine-type D-Ala-D-Ala carboxypeptidase (penicillin-binding protein 5/6)